MKRCFKCYKNISNGIFCPECLDKQRKLDREVERLQNLKPAEIQAEIMRSLNERCTE